jgi:hypothetical protein
MTELNYYNKLAKYKSAFVGHHIFPINFLLAKHIEVLMCGCLGFFEKNDLLFSQLGLIEFVHYIPCTDESGDVIDDYDFYINICFCFSAYCYLSSLSAYKVFF